MLDQNKADEVYGGHVVRKDGLEVLALTGKIEGKRSRGRKRMLWLTSLNEWIREREGGGAKRERSRRKRSLIVRKSFER